jgi:uncharacterized protein YndB with AHSA1/START domain
MALIEHPVQVGAFSPRLMVMAQRIVSVSRVIPAPPEKIFDLLANPEGHIRIDGSGSLISVKSNPERLSKGAKFAMKMKVGASYSITNTVSEFEENRVIAWHHMARFIWRYQLEPVEGGTKVTESFDYSKPWGVLPGVSKMAATNKVNMEKTLERIAELVAAP